MVRLHAALQSTDEYQSQLFVFTLENTFFCHRQHLVSANHNAFGLYPLCAAWLCQVARASSASSRPRFALRRRSHKRCNSCRSRLAACMSCTARRASAHLCVPEEQEGAGAVTTAAWARSGDIVTVMRSHARGHQSGGARAREMRWMCGLRVRETNRKSACGTGVEVGRIWKKAHRRVDKTVRADTTVPLAPRGGHARSRRSGREHGQ